MCLPPWLSSDFLTFRLFQKLGDNLTTMRSCVRGTPVRVAPLVMRYKSQQLARPRRNPDPFARMFDDLFGLAPRWAFPSTMSNDFGGTALDIAGECCTLSCFPSEISPAFPETDNQFTLKLDAPGFPKDAIKVKVANGTLTVEGERKASEEKDEERDGVKYHRVERSSGSFRRMLALPDNVDIKAIESSLRDGVLTINIPKTKPKAPEEHVVDIKDAGAAEGGSGKGNNQKGNNGHGNNNGNQHGGNRNRREQD